MATNPKPDGGLPPISSNVAYDFQTAFVGNANDYSTAMNQQMALQVPLGSQLNLLTAQNMGNKYIDGSRLQDQKLGSLQNVLTGYNTLDYPRTAGAYTTFGTAYGMN